MIIKNVNEILVFKRLINLLPQTFQLIFFGLLFFVLPFSTFFFIVSSQSHSNKFHVIQVINWSFVICSHLLFLFLLFISIFSWSTIIFTEKCLKILFCKKNNNKKIENNNNNTTKICN